MVDRFIAEIQKEHLGAFNRGVYDKKYYLSHKYYEW
jgi:hypothetical protein